MQLNKKFLLITLSIFLHNATVGMETNKNRDILWEIQKAWAIVTAAKKQAYEELKQQITVILNFTADSSTDVIRNHQDMVSVGAWITRQRNNFDGAPQEEWENLMQELYNGVSLEIDRRGYLPETIKRCAIIRAIREIAYPLKPGEDCSHCLAYCIEERYTTK